MKNNIVCFLDTKIEEIDFKKIGIKIRNINNVEIEYIKKKIEEWYYDKAIIDLFKRYQKAKNVNKKEKDISKIQEAVKTYEEIMKLNPEKRDAFIYLDNNDGRLDKRNINKNLKNCIVVEVDENKYQECFGTWDVKSVISRIINFSNYLGSKYKPINFQMTEIENFNNYDEVVNNFKYNKFDNITLQRIAHLLNIQNINFNANFVFMMESFLINNISFENRIINMVSIIEKLLIKKEDDKQGSFKLKVGILIHEDVGWDNDKLAKILKTIYEFRSLLVHGEEDEIYRNKDKYVEVFEMKKIKNTTRKIELRYSILSTIYDYLEKITKLVLNKYLDDEKLCEFLKLN